MLRLKTLAVKLIALILTSSSFLYAGKEEPLIHMGAVVGAGVSQGNLVALGCDLGLLHHFRNDHDKSKYIASKFSHSRVCFES
jgi:chloride channel 7